MGPWQAGAGAVAAAALLAALAFVPVEVTLDVAVRGSAAWLVHEGGFRALEDLDDDF